MTAPARLRLGTALRDALTGALGHPIALLTASIQPLLLEAALLSALLMLDRDSSLSGNPFGAGNPLFTIASIPLSILPLSLLAVSWHRFLLRGETAKPRFFYPPRRADLSYWFYIGVFLLVAFAPVIGLILVVEPYMIQGPLEGSGAAAAQPGRGAPLVWIFTLMAPLYAVLFLYIFARLCLVLPASANGHGPTNLARAWRASRGNGWRIWLLLLPLALLFLFANAFVSFWWVWVFTPYITMENVFLTLGGIALFAWLLHVLMTALFASLLSAVYRQLVPDGSP